MEQENLHNRLFKVLCSTEMINRLIDYLVETMAFGGVS